LADADEELDARGSETADLHRADFGGVGRGYGEEGSEGEAVDELGLSAYAFSFWGENGKVLPSLPSAIPSRMRRSG
jgi:hypothetical protein